VTIGCHLIANFLNDQLHFSFKLFETFYFLIYVFDVQYCSNTLFCQLDNLESDKIFFKKNVRRIGTKLQAEAEPTNIKISILLS
jgi:hypothetical protein